ncbi:MAG: hypothetical protein QGD94_10110, partial [Planctomycetia bacterium]|nr:hypothetical protein [Planctomycetia bacterium]
MSEKERPANARKRVGMPAGKIPSGALGSPEPNVSKPRRWLQLSAIAAAAALIVIGIFGVYQVWGGPADKKEVPAKPSWWLARAAKEASSIADAFRKSD